MNEPVNPHAEVFFTQSYVDEITATLTADRDRYRQALVAAEAKVEQLERTNMHVTIALTEPEDR
jgi:hypothetical protein